MDGWVNEWVGELVVFLWGVLFFFCTTFSFFFFIFFVFISFIFFFFLYFSPPPPPPPPPQELEALKSELEDSLDKTHWTPQPWCKISR